VPNQRLANGEPASIAIVNGFIEELDLSGVPARLRTPVRESLSHLVGRPGITLASIERRLTLASALPGTTLRSALATGKQFGGARLIITAKSDPVSGSLSYDNRLSNAFRNRQFTAQFTTNSLLGFGEQFYGYLSADPKDGLASDAARRAFGGGVILLVGSNGARLNLEASRAITQPITIGLRTRDRFSKASARLSYPIVKDQRRDLLVTASFERLIEQQVAPDFFNAILFRDNYSILRTNLDYGQRDPGTSFGFGASLVKGFGDRPRNFLSRGAATPNFAKLEVNANASTLLGQGFIGQLLVRGQMVFDGGVPSSEVFSLDGRDALSAFTSGQLVADEGVTVRAAVVRPFRIGALTLSPSVYGAAGRGWFAVPTPFDTSRAASVGIGLDASAPVGASGMTASLSIDYGRQFSNSFFPDKSRLGVSAALRF